MKNKRIFSIIVAPKQWTNYQKKQIRIISDGVSIFFSSLDRETFDKFKTIIKINEPLHLELFLEERNDRTILLWVVGGLEIRWSSVKIMTDQFTNLKRVADIRLSNGN